MDRITITWFRIRNWIWNTIFRPFICWMFHQPAFITGRWFTGDEYARCYCRKCGHTFKIPIHKIKRKVYWSK